MLNSLATQLLAEKHNISAGLLNNIENARNDCFNLSLLNMIIKELDLPIEELEIFQQVPIPIATANDSFIELKIPLSYKIPYEKINTYIKCLVESYLKTISNTNLKEK